MRVRSAVAMPLLAVACTLAPRLEAQGSLPSETSAPFGYARSDQVNAVVYRDSSSHVFELALAPGGQWVRHDLTNLIGAPIAATNPTAWVRYDYMCGPPSSAVDYAAPNGDIHELAYVPCQGGVWHDENITAASGAPPALVSALPSPSRWDSFGGNPRWSVTYKSATDAHLWQITRAPQGNGPWIATDITAKSGAPPCGAPTMVSIWSGVDEFFCLTASGHVIHLSQYWKDPWGVEDLTVATSAPLAAASQVAALRRPDGFSSLAYRGTNGRINELYRYGTNTAWSVGSPGGLAGAPNADSGPISYVRQDNTFAIVYNAQGHVIELHLTDHWHYHDLTALANAPIAHTGRPSAYRRADGVNSVVYRGTSGHIYELYSSAGDTWQVGDLTALTQ